MTRVVEWIGGGLMLPPDWQPRLMARGRVTAAGGEALNCQGLQ